MDFSDKENINSAHAHITHKVQQTPLVWKLVQRIAALEEFKRKKYDKKYVDPICLNVVVCNLFKLLEFAKR